MMEKFAFLLGTWHLDYRIPKSRLGEAATGSGTGEFKRALSDKYVFFDYEAAMATGARTRAHAIFAWDEKSKLHRYWWFEDSGNFLEATCYFLEDGSLFLSWQGTPFVQTFRKTGADEVTLWMGQPAAGGKHETLLEVVMTRA
ncbi:MAG: hypothetical protein ABSG19_10245 [Candidatus Aminicenantales bacterium]